MNKKNLKGKNMTQNVTALIYGKKDCPFCKKALELSKEIEKKGKVNLTVEYHDFVEEGLTKEDIAEKVSATSPVQTVPQIKLTIDGEEKYIGGFAEFYGYVLRTDWLK